MIDSPRISVALCTYNGERFIAQQIESILAQSMPVDEIVLGDDASSDTTVQKVEERVAGTNIDLMVRRHNPGLGVRGNFADAISATTGDVIILCDQDDVWHRDKVKKLVEALGDKELVHSDARLVDAEGNPKGSALLEELNVSAWEKRNLVDGDALAVLLKRNLVTGATAAVKGEFARSIMPVPDGWIHDEWLAFIAAFDRQLVLLPEVLTDYRQHENNQIGAKKEPLAVQIKRKISADSDDDARRLTRALSAFHFVASTNRGREEDRERLERAAKHQQARSLMPKGHFSRIPALVSEASQGNYSKYSRGIWAFGRDLLRSFDS